MISRRVGKVKPLILWSLLAAAVGCSLVPLVLIHLYGVNVPFWDDWVIYAPTLVKLHKHQATLADFYVQGAEHRLFIPNLIIALLTLFGWNTLWIMRAEWALVFITSLGILRLLVVTLVPISSERPRINIRVAFIWLLCNLFIFSPQQWENWLWGTGLANMLPMMFTVAALVIVTSELRLWPKTMIAAICCAAAQYSSGNGILSWGIAGVVLAWSDSKQQFWQKRWMLIFWLGSALILTAAYFYRFNLNTIDPGEVSTHLSQSVLFSLAFLGNLADWQTSNPDFPVAIYLGAALLGFYLLAIALFFWFWKNGVDKSFLRNILIWLMIGSFAVASGIMAGPRRGGYGPSRAILSRYVTFSLYLIVALIVLAPLVGGQLRAMLAKAPKDEKQAHQRRTLVGICSQLASLLPSVLTIVLVGIVLIRAIPATEGQTAFTQRLRVGKAGLILYSALPRNDAVKGICSDPDTGYSLANSLNSVGLTHFPFAHSNNANDLREPSSSIRGAIVNVTQRDGKITIRGWDANPALGRIPDAVFLTYEDAEKHSLVLVIPTDYFSIGLDTSMAQTGQNVECGGWIISLARAAFPADIHTTIIKAWALNIETGKATPFASSDPITLF